MKQVFNVLREWEILEAINKEEDHTKKVEMLKEFGNKSPFNYLLALNFNPKHSLALPEGMPPYNRDEATNSDFQGALIHHVAKLRNCFPDMTHISKAQKENIFIRMLESIPPQSADVLVHCKDKALQEMFPTITKELVKEAYPHLVGE